MGNGERTDRECHKAQLLFSSVSPWRLCGPEYQSGLTCLLYVVWRCVWAIFFLASIISSGVEPQDWYTSEDQRIKWFVYLTNWAFFIFCLSQTMRAVISVYCYVKFRDGHYINPEGLTWYLKLNWILYMASSTPAILISLLFWALLYNPEYVLFFDTPISHGVNAVFILLLDLWITGMPVRVLHFWVPFLFGLLYILFAVIYTYAGGTNSREKPYVYSVLDFLNDSTWPAIYCVGALIGTIILHLIHFGFFKLRLLMYSGCRSQPIDNSNWESANPARRTPSGSVETSAV